MGRVALLSLLALLGVMLVPFGNSTRFEGCRMPVDRGYGSPMLGRFLPQPLPRGHCRQSCTRQLAHPAKKYGSVCNVVGRTRLGGRHIQIDEQLAKLQKLPLLVRSFFQAPSVAYIGDL